MHSAWGCASTSPHKVHSRVGDHLGKLWPYTGNRDKSKGRALFCEWALFHETLRSLPLQSSFSSLRTILRGNATLWSAYRCFYLYVFCCLQLLRPEQKGVVGRNCDRSTTTRQKKTNKKTPNWVQCPTAHAQFLLLELGTALHLDNKYWEYNNPVRWPPVNSVYIGVGSKFDV